MYIIKEQRDGHILKLKLHCIALHLWMEFDSIQEAHIHDGLEVHWVHILVRSIVNGLDNDPICTLCWVICIPKHIVLSVWTQKWKSSAKPNPIIRPLSTTRHPWCLETKACGIIDKVILHFHCINSNKAICIQLCVELFNHLNELWIV